MINAGYVNFWFLGFSYLIGVNYLTEVAAR
jgi:hypothetical protein